MDSENIQPSTASPSTARGLPPVTPPSGRFIAQLFLVPGMIVFLAVLLLMMFHNLFGGSQTPPQILRQLDSNNSDIRWRAASDLATNLERKESEPLRSDPQFALDLVERLRQAIAEEDSYQQSTGRKSDKENSRAKAEAEKHRDYLSFLIVAVARLNVPLAIPVLSDLVQRPDRPDDADFIHIRRQALLALTIVGSNVQNFPKLPEEQRVHILETLEQWAGSKDQPQASWAPTALYYLDKPRLKGISENSKDIVHVDTALASCAEADDPFARRMVAWCLRFWEGDLVEPTLKKLAHDDGHGKE